MRVPCPAGCGRGMNVPAGTKPRAMCSQCWPEKAPYVPAEVEIEDQETLARWLVSCPNCTSLVPRPATCCVCHGERQVRMPVALDAVQSVWARPGCACRACAALTVIEGHAFAVVAERKRAIA